MCVIILKRVGEGRLKWVSIVTQLVHTLPQPGQFKPIVIMVIMIIGFFNNEKTLASKINCFPFVCHVPDLKRFLGRIGGKMEILWKNGGGRRFEAASPLKSDHLIRFPKPTMAQLTNLGKSQTLLPSKSSSLVLNTSTYVWQSVCLDNIDASLFEDNWLSWRFSIRLQDPNNFTDTLQLFHSMKIQEAW